ncbi:endolytic transglycosylase MltG [Fodinibius salsisoli]|uniref:endolytic transglycosylase MltG n=1 Tax=Fodinibius salsisoli TaxID=2820877 RepID=UPI0022475FD8|nr:endolytic transglycosylase MltG [Fodinibius salsisoli]
MNFREFAFGFSLWVIVALVIAGSRWTRLYNSPALTSDEVVHIYLSSSLGPEGLADTLLTKGLLKRKKEFDWAVGTLHWKNFKAGHYQFEPESSYKELFSKLGRGLQDPIRLTVLPGYSQSQITQRIAQSFRFDSLSLANTLKDSTFLAKQGIDSTEIIGRIHPNTYSFYWTASADEVITRLLNTFQQSIAEKYKERFKELDKSVNEIVTLASIIEWEAGNDSEKDTISGLYWNRLETGMRLQADPTINFAVGERRRLTFKDYKIDHPYNTYLHSGLPPGPITNPSETSIKAALFPAEHEYLYMVASPEGTHNFSRTYQEHQRKSAEWREWIQKQYRIKRQRERQHDQN